MNGEFNLVISRACQFHQEHKKEKKKSTGSSGICNNFSSSSSPTDLNSLCKMITTKWLMYLMLLLGLDIGINLNHRPSRLADCQAMNGLDGDPNAVVGGYYKPGITAAQILRARGFLAEEFFFTTEDNYILSIIRGRNPLINNGRGALPGKEPVLFIHGILASGALWVVNSKDAKPKDLTNIQVNSTSTEELIRLLKDEPSGFSVPILLMNFGYEVWMLNRRGTLESETRVGGEDRTVLDAFNAIVPTLIGSGFGPNAGLGVFDLFTGPSNSSSIIVGDRSSSGAFYLTEQQQKALSMLNDEQLMKLINGTMAGYPSIAEELMSSGSRSQDVQDKSYLSEFLQPFINLPGALLDFSKFVRRFIRTFDPKFWSFSLDEQAHFDVTAAVDFVLKKSQKRQVALVGHSAGSALILLKLSESPDFADKVSKAVLLAPALNQGHNDTYIFMEPLMPAIQSYLGAIPFPFMAQQIQGILQVVCDFKSTQYTLCEGASDFLFGPSGGQGPITPAFLADVLQPSSARELKHLAQFVVEKKPRKFNFNTNEENMRVYGTPEPPAYELSRIKLQKMSIYAGVSDTLISPEDVSVTLSQLSVPYRYTLIGSNEVGILFNHNGYFIHKRLNELSSIPVLKDIAHLLE